MKAIKTYDDNLKFDGFFFKSPDNIILWVAAKDCFIAGGKHGSKLKKLNKELKKDNKS